MDHVQETHEIQIAELNKARLHFYQFLYLLFSGPMNETVLEQLKVNGNLTQLKEINKGGSLISDFIKYASHLDLQEAKEEFDRLFLGPGSIEAPPWESYYRTKEQILFGETMYLVREKYRRFGLQYRKENKEPDDHLAIELEFMIFLIESALGDNLVDILDLIDAQLGFLHDHLNCWIPKFCEKICTRSESGLYRGAALLLRDFISFDIELLIEMKEALEYV
ncbi:TorD/DmsD family molecular chaperone [Bacillus sp. T33-2]|uniref:TorD/DmsD family molecular chaperone n=1 Tax=Bacillus sp. T33-2 TaxID=2054168 RepID=UPI000C7859E6|nr:molecular chaperone TorD family protein [Bacillus sp. T33-2]PLR98833.1 hypothetical protein CVD19_04155 [Bacillus sp. T33-2]